MQIVTDRGMDYTPEQIAGLDIHFVPLRVTLDGQTYSSGENLQPDQFYSMLSKTESFPITSQPSSGEVAALYRKLAEKDPEILSIHISSGLSGTFNAAKAAIEMVPEAHVTLVDTKTLSCPMGWQVIAAARAIRAGWSKEQILTLIDRINQQSQGLFTINTLKYLVHGGRISHMKGLLASLLNIKPVIGPEKHNGTYASFGQEVTFRRAVNKIGDVLTNLYPEGSRLRVQLLHADNPEGIELLRQRVSQLFDVVFDPVSRVTPALGAHTGPSLLGLSAGLMDVFPEF